MAEIDIERLRKRAQWNIEHTVHYHECIYKHPLCAVLALLDQLESKERQLKWEEEFTNRYILRLHKAQTQRDRLADALGYLNTENKTDE